MTSPPPGAPDYFALFQSMFTPGGATPAANAAPMFPLLDPKELERKISELETVLSWLKATTGVIEMSLQTMKYQQSVLASFADGGATQPEEARQADMEEFARMAGALNPALWAFSMMQQAPQSAGKAARKPAPAAPSADKKTRRK